MGKVAYEEKQAMSKRNKETVTGIELCDTQKNSPFARSSLD